MGGKGAKGSNDAVVNEQRIQAEEARLKEAARTGRLKEGSKAIKHAFEGSPVMGTRKVQKTRQVANPARATWSPGADSQAYNVASAGQSVPDNQISGVSYDPSTGGPQGAYQASNGNWYYPGGSGDANTSTLAWSPTWGSGGGSDHMTSVNSGQTYAQFANAQNPNPHPELIDVAYEEDEAYDTGEKSGGFGDKFYDDYGQSVVDYYQPQVDKQYKDAGKELTYRLARGGTLRSSDAATETADLSEQYDINKANVLNKADTAKSDLRDTVAQQRAKLETALYATEDPTAATNNAIASVRDISLQQPELSPLGAIFNIATIGGANFLKGAKNAQYASAFPDGSLPTNKSRIV